MRAKAKKTPMCSGSLIAIELKGLAAPGEALKIKGMIKSAASAASPESSVAESQSAASLASPTLQKVVKNGQKYKTQHIFL